MKVQSYVNTCRFTYFLCFSSDMCLIELGLCAGMALFYVTVYCYDQCTCNLSMHSLYSSERDAIILRTKVLFCGCTSCFVYVLVI